MNPGIRELWLFHAINGLAGHNPVLDTLARIFVSDYFVPVTLSLTLLGLWFAAREPLARERQQRAVMAAVLALIIANFTVFIFNADQLGMRPRPFEVDAHAASIAATLFYFPPDPTFPSNSVAVAFAMAASAWGGNRRVGIAMGALGGLMGLARVYAGVHFPEDIAAGVVIGIGASFAGFAVLRLIEPVPSLFLQWARRLYLA